MPLSSPGLSVPGKEKAARLQNSPLPASIKVRPRLSCLSGRRGPSEGSRLPGAVINNGDWGCVQSLGAVRAEWPLWAPVWSSVSPSPHPPGQVHLAGRPAVLETIMWSLFPASSHPHTLSRCASCLLYFVLFSDGQDVAVVSPLLWFGIGRAGIYSRLCC